MAIKMYVSLDTSTTMKMRAQPIYTHTHTRAGALIQTLRAHVLSSSHANTLRCVSGGGGGDGGRCRQDNICMRTVYDGIWIP